MTTAPITVNITVTPVDDDNDAPVGNPDAYTLAEDGTLTIPAPGVLGNDTDADQPLFITAGTAPSHGTFELLSNGSFAYTPAPNYNGPDSFTYQASDGIDTTVPVTVSITVTPVNDAPVVESDTIPFPKNGFIGFSLQNRSSDVDNDTLTATLISGTQNGTLFFDGVQRVFSYQPNTDFVGQDSFTYKVNDGTVDSAIATVTLKPTSASRLTKAVSQCYSWFRTAHRVRVDALRRHRAISRYPPRVARRHVRCPCSAQ